MDLKQLQTLAVAATPGPWWLDEEGAICTSGKETPIDLRPIVFDAAYENVIDATYIAAADPQTVLQLVAIAKAAKEYQAGMFRPGSSDLTKAWTALCAALAGVE